MTSIILLLLIVYLIILLDEMIEKYSGFSFIDKVKDCIGNAPDTIHDYYRNIEKNNRF